MAEDVKTTETAEKTETTEQKTTEPKAPAKKSFEELLAEFDGGPEDNAAEPKAKAKKTADDDEDEDNSLQAKAKRLREKATSRDPEVEELLEQERRRNFVRDVKKAGGEDLSGIDDDLIMALALSKLTPALNTAFAKRSTNPKDWGAARKILAAGVSELLGKLQSTKGKTENDDQEADAGNSNRNSAATQAAARAAARATETRKSADSARSEEDARVMAMTPSQRIAEWRRKGINLGL